MSTIREAAYDLLRRHGMTTIFGNPGSNELSFLKDFPKDFRYILGLHEGAVMAMADGYAQASGATPLVSLHSAAGTGSAMGVLTNTVHSKSPVVVLSGQQVRDMVGQGIMVANDDATQLPRPLTKLSTEPLTPKDVIRALAEAIHLANLHPKGPTHLSVPSDDWEHPADENTSLTVARDVVDASTVSPAVLDELVALIDDADSPVLILGAEVDATRGNDHAVALAEQLGTDVWIAPSPPRCPFPTGHPQFAGVLPANVAEIAELLAPHDLAVVVGAPVFRYHHDRPGRYLAERTRLIHVSQDPAEIARAPMGDAFLAPVADTLARLADKVKPRERSAPTRASRTPGVDRRDHMHPDTVFRAITEVGPEDAIYVVESTSTADSFWSNVTMSCPGSFYSSAAGGLGFGLPAAVGIQLARPDRQVIAAIGDGSANFGITGLWSAAHYRIPVVFVILRNQSYGALVNFSRRLDITGLPSFAVRDIDFVRLAEGYGVPAVTAHTEAALGDALKRALAANEPRLIEAHTYHE